MVGGSNGSASLRTSEIFSFHANSWRPGPSLSVPRANMSAVFFNDKLYAIGGFSGKKFLNTLEILSFPSQEWSSYQPAISTHPDGSFFGLFPFTIVCLLLLRFVARQYVSLLAYLWSLSTADCVFFECCGMNTGGTSVLHLIFHSIDFLYSYNSYC